MKHRVLAKADGCQWQWCTVCQELTFNGANAPCAASLTHELGPTDYVLGIHQGTHDVISTLNQAMLDSLEPA